MFNIIKLWFHKRKIYRALGIKSSFLKECKKWNSSEILLKELNRLEIDNSKWLYDAIKFKKGILMKKNEDKRTQIIISFPDYVSMPLGIESVFQSLAGMICEQYEKEHKGVIMWPAGIGSRLKSGMADDRLEFDDSTLHIECSMREMTERDKYNRGLPSTYVPEKRKTT